MQNNIASLRTLLLIILCTLLSSSCALFKKTSKKSSTLPSTQAVADSVETKDENALKPFSEVITDEAKTDEGLFSVHQIDDTYFYEIPDSLLGREFLIVSRIVKAQQGMGYGGEKINTQVIQFQRRNNNILLRRVMDENVAVDSTLSIYESVQNSNFQPILHSFPIKAISEDSASVVIDVSSMYMGAIPALGLPKGTTELYQVGGIDRERSFYEYIHSYPENIEVRNLLTWSAMNPPSNYEDQTISAVLNFSMILLDEEPVEARSYDERVGYFRITKKDYGQGYQKVKNKEYITRFHLVPENKESYLNGELVEPEAPIVFYIGRGTPEKWRSHFKKGVENWNKAFETAGFKNAIVAKNPPSKQENPEWSPEDIRYSVIRYFASETENAQGPHVHDPRSGQILESDINWHHNILKLLKNWYFIQTAAANPEVRKQELPESVMGKLIEYVVTHEVGHTLGLAHNFFSSYSYPVDSLRSPTFTDTHGTASSIMDYARFNYVAQPGDGVKNFMPKIGLYDEWAIKWGYSWFPDEMTQEHKDQTLKEWTRERTQDVHYVFGNDLEDPRSQAEDLSDNQMKANALGMANLKRIVDQLPEWILTEGDTYDEMDTLFSLVKDQWLAYAGHVATYVGGVYNNPKTYGQGGPVYAIVEEELQRDALKWLSTHVFTTPEWLLNTAILNKVDSGSFVRTIQSSQTTYLNIIMSAQVLEKLIEWEARAEEDTFTAYELMQEIQTDIWSELAQSSPEIDVFRRNLQRSYLKQLKHFINAQNIEDQSSDWEIELITESDIQSIALQELKDLRRKVSVAIRKTNDRPTRLHLIDVSNQIERLLDKNS